MDKNKINNNELLLSYMLYTVETFAQYIHKHTGLKHVVALCKLKMLCHNNIKF